MTTVKTQTQIRNEIQAINDTNITTMSDLDIFELRIEMQELEEALATGKFGYDIDSETDCSCDECEGDYDDFGPDLDEDEDVIIHDTDVPF